MPQVLQTNSQLLYSVTTHSKLGDMPTWMIGQDFVKQLQRMYHLPLFVRCERWQNPSNLSSHCLSHALSVLAIQSPSPSHAGLAYIMACQPLYCTHCRLVSSTHTHTYNILYIYTISVIAVCGPRHEVSGSNGSMYTYMTGALGKMLNANIAAQSYERTAHSPSLVLPNQSQSAIFGD